VNYKQQSIKHKRNPLSFHRKKVHPHLISLCLNKNEFFVLAAAPPPQPIQSPPLPTVPAAAASTISPETAASPSGNVLVQLMSQFRMEKPGEPKAVVATTNWEKMSITETQRLLADNGLEK
jgi:hypothetical protein